MAVMTNMVSCWQRNNYQDKLCTKQIAAFLACVNNAVSPTAWSTCVVLSDVPQQTAAKNTTQTRKNWWSSSVVNENLKRFSKKQ